MTGRQSTGLHALMMFVAFAIVLIALMVMDAEHARNERDDDLRRSIRLLNCVELVDHNFRTLISIAEATGRTPPTMPDPTDTSYCQDRWTGWDGP